MDQTFLTMHGNITVDYVDVRSNILATDLTSNASILFVSDSIYDVLGYQPEEVLGKSCFAFFHPEEVLDARYVHERSILFEKVVVLHYARIQSRDGSWTTCECCFTIVYDVLVATIRVYRQSAASKSK
jgi:PAS domain S-box-containing protein